MYSVSNLKCNNQKTPLGVTGTPSFSWQMISDRQNTSQEAFQLLIYENNEQVYDSGIVETSKSVDVTADGFCVDAGERYEWVIKVWDNYGRQTEGRDWFEAAPEQFSAKWIEPSIPGVKPEKPIPFMLSMLFKVKQRKSPDKRLEPVSLLRKEFKVKPGLVKAMAYTTAHGVYSMQFNGKAPDERLLAPEFTAYQKYLCYQSYDITSLLYHGNNACGVMLADGWWAGRIGVGGEACQYGQSRAFLMQIKLDYDDGTSETIISDESFRCSNNGVIRYSDIFIGEKQDHNFNETIEEFSQAGFNDDNWKTVDIADYGYDNLHPQIGEPIVKIKKINPVEILRTPKGETVIDFGQNLAGFVQMKVSAPKGSVIKLEHSEVLDEKGNFLNNIIGVNKDQTDIFICAGIENELFEPHFSFHGFRYVRITGIENPKSENFLGIAISSKMEELSEFECSNGMLNRLYSNTRWSQYSNMISIPTDCPQRERAGWLGDMQVYAPTAAYNQDMNAFLTRWMENVEAEQFDDGQIPCIVPLSSSYRNILKLSDGGRTYCSAGWSEACIIIPYTLYRMYGNMTVLKKHYSMMKKWMNYVEYTAENLNSKIFNRKKTKTPNEIENQKYIWDTGWHYGDWMVPSVSKGMMGSSKGAKITKDITASIYYAHSADLMSQIAKIIGNNEDELYYTELHNRTKKAVAETFISDTGIIEPDLQGSYVMALWYEIIPEATVTRAVARLVKLIEENNFCLDTGFLATPILLDVLMKYGQKDLAYRILYQEKCPSWFYEISKGATTVWEAWDGIKPNGKVGNLSYNHYAFGSVFDWIYRNVGGLSEASAGYKKIIIKPEPDERMEWARCSHKSVYGKIQSDWRRDGDYFSINVEIPCNTTAIIVMPDGSSNEVGSGKYEFICKIK